MVSVPPRSAALGESSMIWFDWVFLAAGATLFCMYLLSIWFVEKPDDDDD